MKTTTPSTEVVLGTYSPLTDWKNEPTVSDLKADFMLAKAEHDEQVSKVNGWLAIRNTHAPAGAKKDPTRSSVQPKLVRRQNEWRYAALTEPFLSNQDVFKVSGRTWEDTKRAEQNGLVVNYQFTSRMNRVKLIDDIIRQVVDTGTCIAKMSWDMETVKETIDVPVFDFYPIDPNDTERLTMLEQDLNLRVANYNAFLDLPEDRIEAANYSVEEGIPVYAALRGYEQQEEERVLRNQPHVSFVDHENFYIDPSCEGELDKAMFIINSFTASKAELLKQSRYRNLDKVDWKGSSPIGDANHSTNYSLQGQQFKDETRSKVVAYEYWGYYDIHDDGTLVPIVATWIGSTMIRMEENPFPDKKMPFVLIPYMPLPKSVFGEPDAELLEDNQAILGALTRGMIDLLGKSANGQRGTAMGFLNAVNRRKFERGEDYEFNPNMPPAAAIHQHVFPEFPNSALNMLTMQNQEAESMTGVKAFAGGMSGEAYGDVAAGIRGMLDASSKREMSILRRAAFGISQIGCKMMMMNQAFLSEEEVVRITNEEFVTVRREDLAGNFDMTVDISTAEIDNAQAQELAFMLQTMGNNMDFEMTKLILAKIARLRRMPDLAHQLENFQPQPDPFTEQMKEIELQKARLELAELESKIVLNQAKARGENADADQADLDFVEQESGTKHLRDMDKMMAQATGNQRLEVTKAALQTGENRPSAAQLNAVTNMQSVQEAIDRLRNS